MGREISGRKEAGLEIGPILLNFSRMSVLGNKAKVVFGESG